MDKILALTIMDQIVGATSGHMASIPNHPVLFGIFSRCADDCRADFLSNGRPFPDDTQNFIKTLRDIADALEKTK